MSRILAALAFGALLVGCRIESVATGPMVLVCTTPNGVETYRSEQSRRWYAMNGTWHSWDGASCQQSMYESCGTRKVSE